MAAGPAYHFVFYLHQQPPGEVSDDEAERIADESLQRVAVSLPPPVRCYIMLIHDHHMKLM